MFSGPQKSNTRIHIQWKHFTDCSGTDPWICFANYKYFIELVLYVSLEITQQENSTRVKVEHRSTEVLLTRNEKTCSKELKHHNLCQQVKHTAESVLSIIQKCKYTILSF